MSDVANDLDKRTPRACTHCAGPAGAKEDFKDLVSRAARAFSEANEATDVASAAPSAA